jgi:uncharacterized DUF497 family protein
MSFEWDEAKNRADRKKHDVTFETAALIFDDPYALTPPDKTQPGRTVHHTGGDWSGLNSIRCAREL